MTQTTHKKLMLWLPLFFFLLYLFPKVYLAKTYTKANGSNINANSMNLSGTIQGGSVVLTSTQGNIVNKTLSQGIDLQHAVGDEHYTIIDKTASITATNGGIKLDAHKNIENIGANLTSKRDITLKAGKDVTLKTLKDERSYDYKFANGYAKGESVKHVQSKNLGSGDKPTIIS